MNLSTRISWNYHAAKRADLAHMHFTIVSTCIKFKYLTDDVKISIIFTRHVLS